VLIWGQPGAAQDQQQGEPTDQGQRDGRVGRHPRPHHECGHRAGNGHQQPGPGHQPPAAVEPAVQALALLPQLGRHAPVVGFGPTRVAPLQPVAFGQGREFHAGQSIQPRNGTLTRAP
ncbi:MAG: hypothetical protein ACK559_33195, partial [bacterium]